MNTKKHRFRPAFRLLAAFITAALLAFSAGCGSLPSPDAASAESSASASSSLPELKNLSIHYLDVGQGDSIFVSCDGSTMLIDAGIPEMGPKVVGYLRNYHIQTLNVVVGTHPHDDHIGGMSDVLNHFNVDTLIMPKVQNNTKTFENLLQTIQNKGLKITEPVPGSTFSLGGGQCTILAPNSASYDDLNDMSVVIRLVYKNRSFLFMGDASSASEADILKKGFTVRSDVLKVGHHGSSTATSPAFLKAVGPQYGVISVGAGNSYGHPAKTTLSKLKKAGVKVYRTDQNGTVIIQSDGNDITCSTEK